MPPNKPAKPAKSQGTRRRLDLELLRQNLATSRSQAHQLIAAGAVVVNGAPASKPARLVAPSDALRILSQPRFVSRGGEKLLAALREFSLDVSHRNCIDVGSSTGGFTDCLLQHGAKQVVAVDVGKNQLHERVRNNPKVVVCEGVNIRHVSATSVAQADIVTADLSFISLEVVMEQLASLLCPGGDLVALVKPQFEVGKQEVTKGKGVVRSAELHRQAIQKVSASATRAGMEVISILESPLKGTAGNIEFFMHAKNLVAKIP